MVLFKQKADEWEQKTTTHEWKVEAIISKKTLNGLEGINMRCMKSTMYRKGANKMILFKEKLTADNGKHLEKENEDQVRVGGTRAELRGSRNH